MNRLFLLALFMALTVRPARSQETEAQSFPNGLLWIHRRVTHNRIAAFRIFFPGGALDETPNQAGLTALMTSVVFKGTRSRDALQLAQETESLGASLQGQSQEDFWEMSGQVPLDEFEPAFELFQDVLLNPTFPAEEFEKEKAAQLNAIRAKKENIFDVAYERLQRELFGDHPYALPEEGTEDTVSRFTPEDLRRWHRARLNPRGAVLLTVGNFTRQRLEPRIKKLFPAGPPPAAEPGWETRAVPRFSSKPAAAEEFHPFEQSFVMLGYPAPGATDADYPALKVLNAHLGSGMSSPLFQAVREQNSLAYEVFSFYPSRRLVSALIIYAGTDPANVDRAHEKMSETIAELLANPLSEEALQNAKRYVRGQYMMDHQTNEKLVWYLGWWEILGKTHLHDAAYLRDIDAVTAADAHRVAEHLFSQTPTVVKIRSSRKNAGAQE